MGMKSGTWMFVIFFALGTVASGAVAQRDYSIRSRALTQRTEEPGEPSLAEPFGDALFFAVPTSLDGPVDPETYVLGPSDELSLILRGPEAVVHPLRVLPEGFVVLPNVGPYKAVGLTLAELKEGVKATLERFYRNVEIDLLLAKPRSFVIYISGEVRKPGPVELTAPSRVSHALAAAGGVSGQGSVRLIEIRKDGEAVSVVDLFKFLRTGDTSYNPVLTEGQIVHVPPRYMKATTVGEVRKSGIFEIIAGETAKDLIDFCGGFATTADTTHLLIERTNPGSEVTNIEFSITEAPEIELMDLDVLVVPDLVSLHGLEPVEVFGGGGREGPFQVTESERLADFVFRLWRFTPRFDIESAVIERPVRDGDTDYIYFNVRDVLQGEPVGNTVLLPGDLISFPPRENQVFVTGEVVTPGGVPFLPGFTAERYVALAGGPNESGTYGKIDIFAVDGRLRKGDRNSPVYRGETIVVKQKTSRILAGWFYGAATITGLMLSIYAVTK
jgi:protein involved in polysaccharide export with SLBB domain